LFFGCILQSVNAQISIQQNFNSSSSLPAGWTTSASDGFSITSTSSCNGNSARDFLYGADSGGFLASPNQNAASNGAGADISFDYKVINFSGGGATPASFGSIQVQYSVNDGSTWTTGYTINSSNHTPSTSCATRSFSIPGTSIPAGSSFKLRFLNTWTTGTYYIHIDNISVSQDAGTLPDCNATLASPLNGAVNVPISLNQITWNNATGIPTGYRLKIGTTPGGTQVANNIDAGNVNSYSFPFHYQTTYYVTIIPYNGNGNATGCSEQSFRTETPVTTNIPWEEGFETTATPTGWTRNSFVIGTTMRLPDADTNVIYKNFRSTITTENFSAITAGEITSGDILSFNYRFADFNSPFGPIPTGAGNFTVALSTDFGITYNDVQTVISDGMAGWKTYTIDLSAYTGDFVKLKITGNWISGNWVVGFDDFYIGQPITCAKPENLVLDFAGNDSAKISWENINNAENYTWYLFESGADPLNDSPYSSGNSSTESAEIHNLEPATGYDFYVRTNCGETDGESQLSEVLSFSTLCAAVTEFPFTETFEENSATLDCWDNETITGNTLWSLSTGAPGSDVTNAHSGVQNAYFYYNSPAANVTRLVSPPMDLSGIITPKLTFWYANQEDDGGQNELRVYYKSSPSGSWTLIPGAVYNTNVNQWTEVNLSLPDASDEYYLAFEGTNNWGYGIVLDDITVQDDFSCPDTTTWNGLAWSNGTPDSSKKAIINGNLILNQNLEACELEVTENGNLEIPDGFSFRIQGSVVNLSGTENFIVDSGANLIQVENAENSGFITVKRDSQPFKRLDYTFWSSPVSGQQLAAFSPETLPGRIYTYEGTSEYIAVPDASDDFTKGKGYLFRAPNNWDSETPTVYQGIFTGTPFNGNIAVDTHSGSYTSIGNPYPSNINADLLMDANSGISTLYFWTNTNPPEDGTYTANNYAAYTYMGATGSTGPEGNESNVPNGIISTGQGFIVQTTENSVLFDNTMRVSDEAEFYKIDEVERYRYWLSFSTQNDAQLNQILIGYMTGATNGIDHQIDGELFGYSGSALYSVVDGTKLVIQGRALPFDVYDVVPLGITITAAGTFKIKLTATDGLFAEGQQIYIHDKYLNIIHNITENEYVFSSDAGEFFNRFDAIYVDSGSNCPDLTNWNGIAWSNGLPDESKKAIINSDLALSSDLEACELEVTPNGSLTIPEGFSFTVNGIITNHSSPGAEGFIVAGNANLIQPPSFNGENTGAIKVLRDSQPMVRLDYTLWSSPVAGQNLFGFSPETVNGVTNYTGSPGRIYIYDGENGYINPTPFTADAVFENGTGYLFRSPNNWSTTEYNSYNGVFTGVPFNGELEVSVHAGNYTSVGNPYPSNIDAQLLMETNPGVSALYFWVNTPLEDGQYTGNNYASYNLTGGTSNTGSIEPGADGVPTGIIAVGQGFIAGSAAASISFDNSMRVSTPAEFFKTDELERHRFWLNLSDENNSGLNQILVGYMTGATQGIDHQIDGKLFGYEGSAIYSLIEGQDFTIQGRALPFETSDVVPLGLRAAEDGKFSISLASSDGLFAEGQVIYLKDNALHIIHDLMVAPYEFESAAGEFNNRFEIVYEEEGTMGTGELAAGGEVLIYKNAGKIEILSENHKIISVEVFDMSGRNLFRKTNVNRNLYRLPSSFGKQIIIVRAETDDGMLTIKKVVN